MAGMPPKRRTGTLDLPDNLYESHDLRSGKTYYRYRDPRTGNFHGFGTDKAAAIGDAKALNAVILSGMAQARIQSIAVPTDNTPKLSAVILRYMELCEARHKRGKLAANTLKTKTSYTKALRLALGDKHISAITVRDIADYLQSYLVRDKERAAQSARTEAIEVWKTAIAEGWTNDNIPVKTRPIEQQVNRARLVLDSWRAIHAAAGELEPWIQPSMELAIVTAQRREDISCTEFKPRKGATAWVEDDLLWVIQQKTGNRVCIPLSLRLEVLNLELGEVIARCRDTTLSRYLVHHSASCGFAKTGDQVWKDTMSRRFSDARDIAAKDGILWDAGKTPPTFHEQRSLAERLYDAQGGIDTRVLLGHRDPRSTAIYKDNRGAEWMRVKTG